MPKLFKFSAWDLKKNTLYDTQLTVELWDEWKAVLEQNHQIHHPEIFIACQAIYETAHNLAQELLSKIKTKFPIYVHYLLYFLGAGF